MFGADCFMVDGAIAVAAHKDGTLLVHVDRIADPEHLQKPHASRAEMGAGRSMGPGWIRVAPEGVARDEDLGDWIAASLERTPRTEPSRPNRRPGTPKQPAQNPLPEPAARHVVEGRRSIEDEAAETISETPVT